MKKLKLVTKKVYVCPSCNEELNIDKRSLNGRGRRSKNAASHTKFKLW